jgi:hypothetical protein
LPQRIVRDEIWHGVSFPIFLLFVMLRLAASASLKGWRTEDAS